ncbi:hypothetical protein DXG01_010954 [Tephrocybe rancida]|nr:hypothetical protein DXG01_010954 [Tephrocybe rancida]
MKELVTLWGADVSKRCRTLNVVLPTHAPENSEITPLRIHGDAWELPKHLRTLSWTGHREQLRLFFCGPFHLTHLTLHCKLSMADCTAILRKGEATVIHLKIDNIAEADQRAMLPDATTAGDRPIVMQELISLTLVSDPDISHMLSTIKFRELRGIDFAVLAFEPQIKDCFATFDSNDLARIVRAKFITQREVDTNLKSWMSSVFTPGADISFE